MGEPVRFPDVAVYTGFNQTVRAETDVRDLEIIQGAIPDAFAGTLYRVGPDPRYPAHLGDDEWTNGDGHVVMFRFGDGHVDLKTRYVRTERFLLEEKARKSLFGRYRNTYTNDPSVAGASNGTANTNVIWHGGKLLALKEDSLPIELDPDTLATKADWNYDGRMTARCMTAHPKLDTATGELLSFSFQARGDCTTDFAYWVIDKHGKITHETWFQAPYPGWVHDFAITEEHVVFPMTPMITDLEVLKKGGPFYQYHPDKEYHFAVMPRYGTAADVRWFRGPSGSAGHMVNAFAEGTKVHLDICLAEGVAVLPFIPKVDGTFCDPVPPQITRLTFDMKGNSDRYTKQPLVRRPGEMPQTDPRYQGRPYRHAYFLALGPVGLDGAGLAHADLTTGKEEVWDCGKGTTLHEPQFVPRRPDAAEGDGWIVAIHDRRPEGHANLLIFDAQEVAAGPVATIRLPMRVRCTFHGMWVPESALRTTEPDHA
jgi:carotenoid cleavage dioxygenase-like enzyme